jgi:hypothetical protein
MRMKLATMRLCTSLLRLPQFTAVRASHAMRIKVLTFKRKKENLMKRLLLPWRKLQPLRVRPNQTLHPWLMNELSLLLF